jgi:hypothetical protein
MLLVGHRAGWTMPGLAGLRRMERWAITLELLVLVAVMLSLGPVIRAWLSVWGVLLLLVVIFGMVVPLVLSWRAQRPRELRAMSMPAAAVLVLVSGFLLRAVFVLSSESVS